MNCLILIISSIGEHYSELENIWRSYINKTRFFSYLFLKCRADIETPQIINDILYVNGQESTIPGVLIKTLKAFEFLQDSYDYIFRTNLSSFLILHRFEKFFSNVTENNVYAFNGFHDDYIFPSGAGFLISKKVIKMLLKTNINNDEEFSILNDDLMIGKYLKKININVIHIPRYDCVKNDNLNISENIFHIRNKIIEDRSLEIENHKKLISKYYS